MAALDFGTLLPFLAIFVAASLVGGFLAGLFGIGGGAIYVPVLYQAFGALGASSAVSMHLALGTSLAIIVPTSVRSLAAHGKRGAVDRTLLKDWLVPVPVGAILGALIAAAASSAELRATFAILTALLSLKLLIGRMPFALGTDLPGRPGRWGAGLGVGVLSSLMGIGGGVFTTTFMTLYGRPLLQGIATSAGVGMLIALPGLVGYVGGGWGEPGLPAFSLGYINLAAFLVIAPLSVLAVPLGAMVAHRLSKRQLEVGFGLFLLSVSARFAWSLL
ncbi:sulfite exporter TauE/SafE family protein [Aurantimonas sp. Leaf443]|uniref:sulfite exporter TauE/SafE family protein n=1 Tax=Aurantimonas sp. Leaf443 TaxID=1736378 RepID=UPI0006F1F680|nr:sulfite exporter TauE/SafE family protein [Aurantimonas sp. Leaf443]KQT86176.1 hypothetical protein ASG48_06285 [Aurantimonas sp. Leaf443]